MSRAKGKRTYNPQDLQAMTEADAAFPALTVEERAELDRLNLRYDCRNVAAVVAARQPVTTGRIQAELDISLRGRPLREVLDILEIKEGCITLTQDGWVWTG